RRLGLRSQLTGEPATFLEEEIDRVRGELLAAEGTLAEFRGEHPTVALDGRQQTLAARLTELGRRLGEAEADRIAAESEHRLARSRSYDALPAVASNPRIQALRAEANRLETRHAELRKSFLAASPEFHDISAQLRGMRARLEREMARATGAIDSRLIVARGTEASLRSDLARTETSLRALDELTRDAIELDQGAAHGRALYEALRARKQEADLLRGMELSSALLLDPAPLPARPSEPRVLYDLGLSLLAGLGLGALAALRVEALHARLETPDDVRRGLGLPPLGVVPDFTLVPGAHRCRGRQGEPRRRHPGHRPDDRRPDGGCRRRRAARAGGRDASGGPCRRPRLAALARSPPLARQSLRHRRHRRAGSARRR